VDESAVHRPGENSRYFVGVCDAVWEQRCREWVRYRQQGKCKEMKRAA